MAMRWMLILLVMTSLAAVGCGGSPPPAKSTDTGSSGVSDLEPETESKE